MSGERPGLQRRLHHEAPHSKYVNCRNHRLALVFVHRMPQFKRLREVDATVLALWKAFKYSSIKANMAASAVVLDGAHWIFYGQDTYFNVLTSGLGKRK